MPPLDFIIGDAYVAKVGDSLCLDFLRRCFVCCNRSCYILDDLLADVASKTVREEMEVNPGHLSNQLSIYKILENVACASLIK